MKRRGSRFLLFAACGAAGLLSALLAATSPSAIGQTGTSTTGTTTTAPPPTTTTAATTTTAPAPQPKTIAAGVTIGRHASCSIILREEGVREVHLPGHGETFEA